MCADRTDLPEADLDELDRPRGMLTTSDRELLMEVTDDLSDRARKQRMVRLRRRVRHGLMDSLELLEMEPADRDVLFNPRGEDLDQELHGGALMLIEFVYLGLHDMGVEPREAIQSAVERAEERIGEEEGEVRDPRAHLSVNLGDTFSKTELRRKLDEEEAMTRDEVAAAIDSLDLSMDDWDALRRINEQAVDREVEPYSIGVLRNHEPDDE